MDAYTIFTEKLRESLEAGQFVKLTLSKPAAKNGPLQNIYARIVEIKGRARLSFTLRYATRDITRNCDFQEAVEQVGIWLGHDFLHADLFTLQQDIQMRHSRKRKASVFFTPPAQRQQPSTSHDKLKTRLIDPAGKSYLQELQITNKEGKVLKSAQKKFRQISKYIEIVGAILRQVDLPEAPRIADMGSGKGYLTFALYDYLQQKNEIPPSVTGIELRQNLVDLCNDIARREGFKGLSFLCGDILDYQPERIDMLIALHACDIATDIAIARGIKAGASVIIVAPCCHKQIRREMDCRGNMQSILKHGILEERQAELLTDGLRALLMEDRGYQTKVFEFVSTEHTPKNLMIVGIKGTKNEEALTNVEAIKKTYGIGEHYLEKLLKLQKDP